MSGFKKKNLQHIKSIFEEKTGVELDPSQQYVSGRSARITLVFAAVVLFALTMAGFSEKLFTPLKGDELFLSGTYHGNGIISVYVENRSDTDLIFQEETKLFRWVGNEEVKTLGGKVVFENTNFPAKTSGTMVLDISDAYDVMALEHSDTNEEWFYFVLTNKSFLFGHDWMCSIHFGPAEEKKEAEEDLNTADYLADNIDAVEEELRFYFEKAYDEVMAFNGANFQYQQKVEEVLKRFPGKIVPAVSPVIMVGGPSDFLEPEPRLGNPDENTIFDSAVPGEQQYLLTGTNWTYTDGYGRMVASADEKAWSQVAVLPNRKADNDGGTTLPLVFLFVYPAKEVKAEQYVFVYGQIYRFGDLAQYQVLSDEYYCIYNFTDLIYTDLDAYLDYFLSIRKDVYCDDQIRQRVRNIYEYYQDKENIRSIYGYFE